MYIEPEKIKCRKIALSESIRMLTKDRKKSTICNPEYFQNVYNFMKKESWHESDKDLVSKLTKSTFDAWKNHFEALLSTKDSKQLRVAYLAGPNPENDMEEMIKLGILPENVWAFEFDNNNYSTAVENLIEKFPQAKIFKGKIGDFFDNTAIKFDIVYLDFCGTFFSSNKANKNISTLVSLFNNHALNSPGIVITNFAYISKENGVEMNELIAKIVAVYLFPKAYADEGCSAIENSLDFIQWFEKVKSNLEYYYSEFISRFMMDLTAVIIPFSRISNCKEYYNFFFKVSDEQKKICKRNIYEYRDDDEIDIYETSDEEVIKINSFEELEVCLDHIITSSPKMNINNSSDNNEPLNFHELLSKYDMYDEKELSESLESDPGGYLASDMEFFSLPYFFDMLRCDNIEKLYYNEYDHEKMELEKAFYTSFYDSSFKKTAQNIVNQIESIKVGTIDSICLVIYLLFAQPYVIELYSTKLKELVLTKWDKYAPRACDVFTFHSIVGLLLGQLAVPYHINVGSSKRWKYKAKETKMFTDMFVIDECRYIYDMMPTIDMFKQRIKNKDAQMCYRIPLDALNKNHFRYNTELFFGNAVVGINHSGFEEREFDSRISIEDIED